MSKPFNASAFIETVENQLRKPSGSPSPGENVGD
jgi:hypothetical protein